MVHMWDWICDLNQWKDSALRGRIVKLMREWCQPLENRVNMGGGGVLTFGYKCQYMGNRVGFGLDKFSLKLLS